MSKKGLRLVSPKSSVEPARYTSRKDLLEHAKLPPLFWTAEVDPERSPFCWKYLLNLESNLSKGYGLLLTGPNGTGKTTLAGAIVRSALMFDTRVLFITSQELKQAFTVEATMHEDVRLSTLVENRRLLVIDDLASEYRGSGSGFAEQTLINLMRLRTSNRRSTIITTNMKPEDIESRYSTSMLSLIAELCIHVDVKGADKRREEKRMKRLIADASGESI